MDDLEREIAQALALDPAPDFVARVRTRIASEHIGSSWCRVRQFSGAACAAAAIAVVMVWTTDRPSDIERRDIPLLDARAISGDSTWVPRDTRSFALPRERRANAAREGRSPAAAFMEFEVMIAQEEAAALRRLVRGDLATARISEGSATDVALDPPQPIDLRPVAEIAVINIEPLRIAANPEGARQ